MATRSRQQTDPGRPVRGITRIAVSGYKSLAEECSIEVRPLTLLAGANSSGKSSIMQPVLLLKQTLEAAYEPEGLRIDEPNVRFNLGEQLFSRSPGWRAEKLVVQVGVGGAGVLTQTFGYAARKAVEARKVIELLEMAVDLGSSTVVLRPGMADDEIASQLPEVAEVEKMRQGMSRADKRRYGWRVCPTRGFLEVQLGVRGQGDPASGLWSSRPGYAFQREVQRVLHLPGLRGNPRRTYPITATGPSFPGTFEDYTASVVYDWKKRTDGRLRKLGEALAKLGLTWKADAHQLDDTQVELLVGRLPRPARGGAQDLVSIADVGFGVSQVLPVLVALLVAEAGQLVYLEQPEIHLHPRAQLALAEILAEAAKRGVRVVAETHSDKLLLGVQTQVAEGHIAADKVKLHWFSRRRDGVTEVRSADVDDAGTFGDWPEDFSEVDLKTESRYLDAAEARLAVR